MGHIITIDLAKLDAAYERMMDEVYLMYHTHPTMLTPISLSEAEIAQGGEYNALARGLAREQVNNPDWRRFLPNGCQIVTRYDGVKVVRLFRDGKELAKKTIYPRDQTLSNGIPVGITYQPQYKQESDKSCITLIVLAVLSWVGLAVWALLQ